MKIFWPLRWLRGVAFKTVDVTTAGTMLVVVGLPGKVVGLFRRPPVVPIPVILDHVVLDPGALTSIGDLDGTVFTETGKQRFRILSIDGGGVKGVIPAVLLERLEGQLIFEVKQWLDECTNQHGDRYNIFQQQELNLPAGWEGAQLLDRDGFLELLAALNLPQYPLAPDAVTTAHLRIPDFFDVLAGTSSGGLTAAFLATPDPNTLRLRTAASVKQLYITTSKTVFPEGRFRTRKAFCSPVCSLLYDGKKLEEILRVNLGRHTTLMATVKPCILPSFDLDLQQPNIWETGVPADTEWQTKSALLWQVCRATAAPPTFLAPGEVDIAPDLPDRGPQEPHRFVDGGLVANDPLYYAYRWPFANLAVPAPGGGTLLETEFFYHPSQALDFADLILSLGTGYVFQGRFQDTSWWPPAKWAKHIIYACLKGSGQAVHYGMFYPLAAARSEPAYLRLNPAIHSDLDHLDGSKDVGRLCQVAADFLTETGHRNVPGCIVNGPFGDLQHNNMTLLQDLITRSYSPHDRYAQLTAAQRLKVDNVLAENNGQALARFAQLLVREWVLRVRLGARRSACYNAVQLGLW